MDIVNTLLVSISMSMDATCVGATDGMLEHNMKKKKMLLIAFSFGIFQAVMPLIGYLIGFSFRDILSKYIPWIAFAILCLLGLKSILDWVQELKKKEGECTLKTISFKDVIIQSLATSIDALCIGFIYIEYPFKEAILVFLIIGIVTFVFSFTAIILGKKIGDRIEKIAGLIAGIVFILVGLKILLENIL